MIIKKKLTLEPTQLEIFRSTVFGRFVDVEYVFYSALVHCILLREVVDGRRPDVMTFNIRGTTVVTFLKAVFLLITGLWRSPIVGWCKKSCRQIAFESSTSTMKWIFKLISSKKSTRSLCLPMMRMQLRCH